MRLSRLGAPLVALSLIVVCAASTTHAQSSRTIRVLLIGVSQLGFNATPPSSPVGGPFVDKAVVAFSSVVNGGAVTLDVTRLNPGVSSCTAIRQNITIDWTKPYDVMVFQVPYPEATPDAAALQCWDAFRKDARDHNLRFGMMAANTAEFEYVNSSLDVTQDNAVASYVFDHAGATASPGSVPREIDDIFYIPTGKILRQMVGSANYPVLDAWYNPDHAHPSPRAAYAHVMSLYEGVTGRPCISTPFTIEQLRYPSPPADQQMPTQSEMSGIQDLANGNFKMSRNRGGFQPVTLGELFVLGTDGKLWLVDGPFGSVPPTNRKQVDASVNRFQAISSKEVFILGLDGKLWHAVGPFGQQLPPARDPVDASVRSFHGLNGNNVLVLGQDSKLWLETAPFGSSPPTRVQIDANVSQIQGLGSKSAVFVLGLDGKLWLDYAPFGTSVPPLRKLIDANVRSFYAIDLDTVLVLGTDAKLWLAHAPFGSAPPMRELVDQSVAGFEYADGANVFVIGATADLPLRLVHFDGTRSNVDSSVLAVKAIDANHVLVLGFDHKLWLEQAPVGTSSWSRTPVDGSVSQ